MAASIELLRNGIRAYYCWLICQQKHRFSRNWCGHLVKYLDIDACYIRELTCSYRHIARRFPSHFTSFVCHVLQAPWECFQEVSKAILSELSSTVSTVAQNEVTLLSKAIQTASQICCFGGGKEGLVMRGLASRLHHLGFASYYIGDTNLPQFGSKDLLLTSAGQSCNSSVSFQRNCESITKSLLMCLVQFPIIVKFYSYSFSHLLQIPDSVVELKKTPCYWIVLKSKLVLWDIESQTRTWFNMMP